MIALGPIIVLFLFVGVLILASFLLNKLQAKGNYLKGLLIGYFGLLFLSMILYYALPIESSSGKVGDEEEIPFLFDYLNRGKLDEVNPSYIKNQWTYSFQGDQLNFQALEDDYFGFPIYVEKVQNGQKVEAFHYQTPTIVDGYPLYNHTVIPIVEFATDTLTIDYEFGGDRSFVIFKPEFPFRLYSGIELMPYDYNHGDDLIYIRVPEGVDISIDEGSGIQIIDEQFYGG